MPDDLFDQVLQREIHARSQKFLDSISRYRQHPYRRDLEDPQVIWQEGTTRLLDYGGTGPETGNKTNKKQQNKGQKGAGIPLLMVPSLINRGYILDLSADCSLLRWLADQGFHPYLIDWGAPGQAERGFSLTDYIAGRLDSALTEVLSRSKRPPLLGGYCMGGLLALGLACRRQQDLAGLALLATPWDFSAGGSGQRATALTSLATHSLTMEMTGELPVDGIQALFAAIDPENCLRKFLRFGELEMDSDSARAFVALEDWLNDGVALAKQVAHTCLGQWYGENSTAEKQWQVAGQVVDPATMTLPSLCLVPAQDRIVPPGSAVALGEALPNCEILRPPAGHIGMVVSRGAPSKVWQPLADWLHKTAGV
ncbi:alpha/beta fold hydrolase [Rhodovibrionaceae bacterium A322]